MTELQKRVIATVLWAPITWIPFTIASFGALVLGLPWWVNMITYTGAILGSSTFWASQIPRLSELWKLELTEKQIEEKIERENQLVQNCLTSGFELGWDTLERAYQIERALENHYKEKEWLSQFPFLQDATALIDEIEKACEKGLEALKKAPVKRTAITELNKQNKEAFIKSLEALEDTLFTCEKIRTDTHVGHGYTPASRAKSAAEEILEKNKATKEALDFVKPETEVKKTTRRKRTTSIEAAEETNS